MDSEPFGHGKMAKLNNRQPRGIPTVASKHQIFAALISHEKNRSAERSKSRSASRAKTRIPKPNLVEADTNLATTLPVGELSANKKAFNSRSSKGSASSKRRRRQRSEDKENVVDTPVASVSNNHTELDFLIK